MYILFLLLSLAAFICFIIGMVNPKIIVFWTKKKKRGMACLYLIPLFVFFIIALSIPSGQNNISVKTNKTTSSISSSSSDVEQAKLNASLKKEAVKADFVQLNGHESSFKDQKIFIEGTVGTIEQTGQVGQFSVSTKEGSGYGTYDINSMDTENHYNIGTDIKQNDKVKIYGTITGESNGGPVIDGIIVEKE